MKDFFNDILSPAGAEVSVIPVASPDGPMQGVKEDELPDSLPILALRNAVLFPGTIYPITIGREKSLKLIQEAEKSNAFIGTVPQKDFSVEEPKAEDLSEYGTVARIIRTLELPDGTVTAILQGFRRFRLEEIYEYEPYMLGRVQYLEDDLTVTDTNLLKITGDLIKEKAIYISKNTSFVPKEAVSALKSIDNFEFLVNFVATTVDFDDYAAKIGLLGMSSVLERGEKLLEMLGNQYEIVKLKNEINQKVKGDMDQQQREYYLNSQLRTIQEELGMDDMEELDRLQEKAEKKKWPEEMKEVFEKEMMKLERQNPNSPEYSTQMNYLQFMVDLPWNEYSKDNLDLKHAKKVLDKEHYGLDTVKERIIEYLAVLKLKGNMKSPILCLYGPPGVGKTSLGRSVAEALGRKYIRISLGGMHDESEIRGHRKTYIGALPGRILNGIMRAGTSNPVIVLDEVDKIGNDFHGDPSSALLEVLDPEQNTTFHDNYLDLDYDLSHVLFITTANTTSTIQPALRDRMEMIPVSGYLAEEKMEIARHYLIPKQLEEHGLKKNQLKIGAPALSAIIEDYTRESGVRSLEKQIAKIARKEDCP